MDATGVEEGVILFKFGIISRLKDGEGFTTVIFDYRKAGNIARTVRDVEHAINGNTAVALSDVGIDIDGRIFVSAFVDLKNIAGLNRVVDNGPNLTDFKV